jgi:predicted TIM-barrel fold metal-dependent hydrolase
VTRPTRIVDCHVHFWDPARTDWYPYLSGRTELNMGDVTGMSRRFDVATYRAESPAWNVEKFVHVAAATGRHSVEETLGVEQEAPAEVAALIGGLPPAETVAESIGFLDTQLAAPRFRGVRPMGVNQGPLPAPEVLRALQERGLLFELMARTDELGAAAVGLTGYDELTVVVEHVGWPRSNTAEEFAAWTTGLQALAAVRGNVVCKLSGLAMPLGSMEVEAYRPWIDHALEVFGIDRCLFASNFPVDGNHGTLDQLWSTYAELVDDLDAEAADKLFATNAERVYRC